MTKTHAAPSGQTRVACELTEKEVVEYHDMVHEKNLPSAAPRRFQNASHQANYASFSRMACCLVNEGLVHAYVVQETVIETEKSSLYAWMRNGKGDVGSYSFQFGDFLVPLAHQPIYEQEEKGFKRITYLHPQDQDFMAFSIVPSGTLGSKALSSQFSQRGQIAAISNMDSCNLMWMAAERHRFDTDKVKLLCDELTNSVEHATYAFDHRNQNPTLTSSVIEWEQSIVEGHPIHPMHKSRYAVAPVEQVPPCSMELVSPDIRFVRLSRNAVTLTGDYEQYAKELFPPGVLASIDWSKEAVLPVHPLQLPNVYSRFPDAILISGKVSSRAQSSLRTVSLTEHAGWSIKLPFGVRVTSSLRTITPWTTYMSPSMVGLLEKLVADSNGTVRVLKDVAGASVIHESTDEAKHLGCVIRRDIAHVLKTDEIAIVGAALAERDAQGISFAESAFGLDTPEKRLNWFKQYSEVYLRGFLTPAHKYGFAFEAHGQNVLAIFNIRRKCVVGFGIRDFGGVRAHQDTLQRTLGECLPVLAGSCNVTETIEQVYTRSCHTLIQCHMQELIRALNLHYSGEGWRLVRNHLKSILPEESSLYRFLVQPRVEFKCFIKMKLQGLYRDCLYARVPNILLYRSEQDTQWNENVTMR